MECILHISIYTGESFTLDKLDFSQFNLKFQSDAFKKKDDSWRKKHGMPLLSLSNWWNWGKRKEVSKKEEKGKKVVFLNEMFSRRVVEMRKEKDWVFRI